MKAVQWILAQPRSWVIWECVVTTAMIGWLDHITAWEVSFFILYAGPIFLMSWRCNRRVGLSFSLLCGAVWVAANHHSHPYASAQGFMWATINRTLSFVFVALGASAMRQQHEEARARLDALTRTRELEQELVRAAEREQMRIGRDLHDGVCQNLAAIDCATECLKAELEGSGGTQAASVGVIQKMVRETVLEARSLARGLFPVQMDPQGLAAALQELVTVTNQLRHTSVTFSDDSTIRLTDPSVAMHLYRIARESLSNAVRHSRATEIEVALREWERGLVLSIVDRGCGFPQRPESSEGMGLRTMLYRAQVIGAALEVQSSPGAGTAIFCKLPVPA